MYCLIQIKAMNMYVDVYIVYFKGGETQSILNS